ncbi:hypothetical protein HU734_004570 [Pseudomonas wayambapalatensis]|uniref:hypothetical protein n=1 Tax=Pseudomonas TaxID=286 RepID=UPI00164725E8|nr:hypothetical protein [Pseudomonas sp. RW3S2]MBC3423919.1 hypothetical protein [Pseudomonas sp. RW3S2]QXI44060.1 hypothetical protein HU734_004570 [Pseudomonas wayambapalatensis]
MKLVSECFSVARSQLAVRIKQSASPKVRRSRLVKGAELVAEIQQQVSELPNYGCRRVWGLRHRARETRSLPAINVKRVYRVMRDYNLLPDRRIKQPSVPRRNEGRIPVQTSDTRWCSDGFEFHTVATDDRQTTTLRTERKSVCNECATDTLSRMRKFATQMIKSADP